MFNSRLASDFAQLPVLWSLPGVISSSAYISDMDFDRTGELLASCSTDGRIAVHQTQQFEVTVRAAEEAAVSTSEAALEAALDQGGLLPQGEDPGLGRQASGRQAEAEAAASAAAAATLAAASSARHSVCCEPLLTISTRLNARAARWSPKRPDDIVCGFANSHELHVFDLASPTPQRAVRVLRSGASYGVQQGVNDVAFLPEASMVIAGGRDGQLRVWDERTPQALLRQSVTTTGGWTLGTRAQSCRAGAINTLAVSADERRICAGTEEGCILVWDARVLNATLGVVRVGPAVAGRAGGEGIVAMSHHPGLRHTLCAQLASGLLVAVNADAATVLAVRRPAAPLASPAAPPPLPTTTLAGSASATSSAADAPATGALHQSLLAAAGVSAAASSAAPVSDWRVNRRRGAWMGGVHSDAWWWTGVVGTSGLTGVVLDYSCTQLASRAVVPTSNPVAAVAAHPRSNYLALGLQDNSIAFLAPCAHLPTAPTRRWHLPTAPTRDQREQVALANGGCPRGEEAAGAGASPASEPDGGECTQVRADAPPPPPHPPPLPPRLPPVAQAAQRVAHERVGPPTSAPCLPPDNDEADEADEAVERAMLQQLSAASARAGVCGSAGLGALQGRGAAAASARTGAAHHAPMAAPPPAAPLAAAPPRVARLAPRSAPSRPAMVRAQEQASPNRRAALARPTSSAVQAAQQPPKRQRQASIGDFFASRPT